MAKLTNIDYKKCQKSTFTLTFAIEIIGIDVWHDCNEGWLDIGSCEQAVKLQYQLYAGQNYDLQIQIWPHVAKIWCGSQYGWVRTWQFLERRWLTFTIHHIFPVRVLEFRNYTASITPSFGLANLKASLKNEKNFSVFVPPLSFGERRYFGKVLEIEEDIKKTIRNMIWEAVVDYIPTTYMDKIFDVPLPVSDKMHQDTVLFYVENRILRKIEEEQVVDIPLPKERDEKNVKGKKKKIDTSKQKFELSLSGDAIMAGTGRITAFETSGERPNGLGEIIAFISSNNLPAHDDLPIVFVNIDTLFDIPVNELKKLRIEKLYTRWTLGGEIHKSKEFYLTSKTEINFKDHHSYPLTYESSSGVTAEFLDNPFEIQLCGLRSQPSNVSNRFFGYEKGDRDFGINVPPKPKNDDIDIIVAVTKIDAQALAKGINAFIKGEYSLYPPSVSVAGLNRESMCTNDINAIRASVLPDLVVQPYIILEANMSLEVSLGLVGCKVPRLTTCFSRLYCLINDNDTEITTSLLQEIADTNKEADLVGQKQKLLTGFALDTGDIVFLYLEGPRDGLILRIWDMTAIYYPKVKPVFSSSARYSSRLYEANTLSTALPFVVLKMYVPLGALLACPAVYARPALPLPARSVSN